MKKITLTMIFLLFISGCSKENIIEQPEEKVEEKVVLKDKITTSFVAVGDNLIHGGIYGDPLYVNNNYDYRPIYANVKEYIQTPDIAFINQETMLGGHDLGLSSYPMFNSPQEIGDAIVDAGFDWVNHATNHTLDKGELGVIKTLEYWDQNPNITTTGIARSIEERNQSRIIEKNGVKFGLLSYSYGTNGISIPQGKDYLINLIDKDQMEADINQLKNQVDSILVSLHWGVEYTFSPNDHQQELAQFLSDLGVDVIIGHHPHVIQPMEMINGVNGNETLVIYSLGNFLSAQDYNYRMLGGMANFDIVFDPNDKTTKINNVSFTPTITHYGQGFRTYNIYRLKDYTNDLARTHGLAIAFDMSKEYFTNLVNEVMNDQFEIIY